MYGYGEVPEELQQKIREHYDKGQGSIQDYARVYGVPMEKVLEILGMSELKEVELIGDLVDERDMGRWSNEIRAQGDVVDVPFDVS